MSEKKHRWVKTLPIVDFICHSSSCKELAKYLNNRSISVKNFESLAQYLKKLKKSKQVSCLIEADGNLSNPTFVNKLTQIKKINPKNKIILMCSDSIDINAQIFNEKGLFKVVQLISDYEIVERKIAKGFSIKLYKEVEGKSKVISDHIINQLESFATIDQYFDIYQGISMKHPIRHLTKNRENESDIEFIMNNQVEPYCIRGAAYFWNGDTTPVISGPSLDIFSSPKKIILYSNAPPFKAAFDAQKRAFGKSSYGLIPKKRKKISLLCCLAFFNSRIFDFYLNKMFNPIPREGADASFLSIHDIKQFPLPSKFFDGIVPDVENKVVQLESLIKCKPNGKSREIVDLKNELDQIFFKIFDLNNEKLKLLKDLHF